MKKTMKFAFACVFFAASLTAMAQGSTSDALLAAAEKGDINTVQSMLESGAEVNGYDLLRNTPLHQAAFYGHERICLLLIKKGAQVDALNEAGFSPLYLAVKAKQSAAVKTLATNGANVNAKYGNSRTTALHMAASTGKIDVVETLLIAGADPNVKDMDGNKPADLAKDGDYDAVKKLLKDKRWKK